MDEFAALRAKQKALEFHIPVFFDSIQRRTETLTVLSAFSAGLITMIATFGNQVLQINRLIFAKAAIIELTIISLVSLGIYVFVSRLNVLEMHKKITSIVHEEDWTRPLPDKQFRVDFLPEFLFFALIVGVGLFCFSLVPIGEIK